jgi:intracellular sulfur oxidation DsrE/DsrF family protein
MLRGLWITVLVLAAGATTMLAAQEKKADQPSSGWTYPVIKDNGRAWPLPKAAVQPQKGRTYKALFDVSRPAPNPNEILPGLAHASRMINVFAALGVPPKNLKVVAVFHGPVGYAAMNNDVYRAKFNVDNPNIKVIEELKAAGVELLLCGQTLHELNFNEKDMLPELKLATSAMVVLVTYQNDGYALMPF